MARWGPFLDGDCRRNAASRRMRCRPAFPRAAWPAAACFALCLSANGGRAADPQPYDVTLKPTGESALDTALHDSASLISLRESAPVGPFALLQRAREDEQRFRTALNSFGYYKATMTVTIAGKALDDPGLSAALEAMPANPPAPVAVSFDLGPRFKLGKVVISTPVPGNVQEKMDLKPGQPAMASDVLAAQGRLLTTLQEDGYPLATVPVPVATLRPGEDLLDVDFQPKAGPKADIGPIDFSGLKDMNESFVRRRLTIHEGELYQPSAIEAARTDLLALGVFSSVRVDQPTALNAQG